MKPAKSSAGNSPAPVSPSPAAPVSPEELESAFSALKTYDYGSDRGSLCALDQARAAAETNLNFRDQLESRLVTALRSPISAVAKDYVCRLLSTIGSAKCVSALSELLSDHQLAHIARLALERIPGNDATRALRESLDRLSGFEQVGVINSLGIRRDSQAVAILRPYLRNQDPHIAAAAITALGQIGSPRAAAVLRQELPAANSNLRVVLADACLTCAEHLREIGRPKAATTLCQHLTNSHLPPHIAKAAKCFGVSPGI
jgi:HEAT repeat protein